MVKIAGEKDDQKSDKIRWLYIILSPPNLILSLDDWADNKVSAYFEVGWSSIWMIFLHK